MVSLWRLSARNLGAGGQWEYRGIRYTRLKLILHAKSAPERRLCVVYLASCKDTSKSSILAYVHKRPSAAPRDGL